MKFFVCLFLLAILLCGARAQNSLQQLVDAKEAVVSSLAAKATVVHLNRCNDFSNNCGSGGNLGCSIPACGNDFPATNGFTCNSSWGKSDKICGGGSDCSGLMTSVKEGTVRFAPDTNFADSEVGAFSCSSKNMDELFMANEAAGNANGWQYTASMSGVSRFYPGQPQYRTDTCCPYDPRIRPWFVAATSGPKDVVLVMDTSGSMKGDRLAAMKSTAQALLDSMTNTDYVQVVEFNTNARAAGSSLLQGTTSNLESLKDFVGGLEADGGTYMGKGFTEAFNILSGSSSSSACTRIVIFLTDGKASDQNNVIPSVTSGQSKLGSNPAHVFTYSMGSGADHTLPKQIACENDGVWASISDGVDPLSEMGQYYQFLASGIDSSKVRWSTPYEDAFGLGEMTTAAIPVYDRTQSVPLLVGVVATDVLMSDLKKFDSGAVNELMARSKSCPTINLKKCQMQHIRGASGQCSTSAYSGFSISDCNARSEIITLKTCDANSAGVNGVLCSKIESTTQVAAQPLTTKEVVCCSGCNAVGERNGVCRLANSASTAWTLLAAVMAVLALVA